MRVLWLGGLHSDHALLKRVAVNQAAVKWTRGLIGGLRENGVDVFGLTHCYEQAWPQGEFFPGTQLDFDPGLDLTWCKYMNVPGLREWDLGVRYSSKVKKIFEQQHIDAMVCYNVLHPYHVKAMGVARRMGIPCFPIILDGDDPRKDSWRWLLQGTKDADGIVFLSNWMARNYPGDLPVLQMDGGSAAWFGDEAQAKIQKNLIVYSGGLDHWRGLDFLVEVVKQLTNSEYRFIICGKCDQKTIYEKMGCDPRIEVKGFVSDRELHEICLRASVFLNTRDPGIADNILNFPSKIPNYLAYGKPVVSTWIDSLSDDYRKVLQVVESDAPSAFADQVSRTLMWSEAERQRYLHQVREWFLETRLWAVQARRLEKWMTANM